MRTFFFTLSIFACALPALAQTKVYLITIGPGEEAYEKFGHNMLWIHDPVHHYDPAYNWGIFSFDEGFIGRFLQGRLMYWMDAWDANKVLEEYKKSDRSIWIQELNLSEDRAQLLLERCEVNRQPQFSRYKYDYYRDNCSTRVRDMLDGVLQGQIKGQLKDLPTGTTYRWHTRRLTQDAWWLYLGLDYAMGHPIDHPISAWEECFLPVKMMERLEGMKIRNEAGEEVPLVLNRRTDYQSKTLVERATPPGWGAILIFMAVGVGLGLALVMLARGKAKWSRIGFVVLVVVWTLLSGFAGLFSTYTWFFTDHVVTRYNENWLQLNPLAILLVIMAPAALAGKKWGARYVAVVVAGFSVIGLVGKALPWWMYQVNWDIIALALPANLGLAWAVWMISQRRGRDVAVTPRKASSVKGT